MYGFFTYFIVTMNVLSFVFSKQTDCNDRFSLVWNGAINDIYHLVKDHLGQYRRQPGEKFDGYDAYLKDDKGSKSYLSFKFGFGWRIDHTIPSSPVPAIAFQRCKNPCPEKCSNNGLWAYRNNWGHPIKNQNKNLHWNIDLTTTTLSFSTLLLLSDTEETTNEQVSSESTVSANYDDFRKVFSTEKATNDNLAMTSPMILSSHSEKNLSDNKNNSSKVIKYTTPSLKNNDTLVQKKCHQTSTNRSTAQFLWQKDITTADWIFFLGSLVISLLVGLIIGICYRKHSNYDRTFSGPLLSDLTQLDDTQGTYRNGIAGYGNKIRNLLMRKSSHETIPLTISTNSSPPRINDSREVQWKSVIKVTYEVVNKQMDRNAFDNTFAKTLLANSFGEYKNWLQNNRENSLHEKVKMALEFWRQYENRGNANVIDLVLSLHENQDANSCIPLIRRLADKFGSVKIEEL